MPRQGGEPIGAGPGGAESALDGGKGQEGGAFGAGSGGAAEMSGAEGAAAKVMNRWLANADSSVKN